MNTSKIAFPGGLSPELEVAIHTAAAEKFGYVGPIPSIRLRGELTKDYLTLIEDEIIAIKNSAAPVAVVFIDSPGGNVEPWEQLERELTGKKLIGAVKAGDECGSAAALFLACRCDYRIASANAKGIHFHSSRYPLGLDADLGDTLAAAVNLLMLNDHDTVKLHRRCAPAVLAHLEGDLIEAVAKLADKLSPRNGDLIRLAFFRDVEIRAFPGRVMDTICEIAAEIRPPKKRSEPTPQPPTQDRTFNFIEALFRLFQMRNVVLEPKDAVVLGVVDCVVP